MLTTPHLKEGTHAAFSLADLCHLYVLQKIPCLLALRVAGRPACPVEGMCDGRQAGVQTSCAWTSLPGVEIAGSRSEDPAKTRENSLVMCA
jgi:hypothetical protein